jgi:hypothetical protein
MVRIVDGSDPAIPYSVTTTHDGHAEAQEGKSAMTRKSIFTLVTLLVALFIVSQASVVTAHDVCGDPPGQWCVPMATRDGTVPLVVGNAAGTPAENTQGEELTPLRGHEQVALSLAQPVVAETGLWP